MSGETNPYKELTVNNTEKIEPLMTQMEQQSILSNILNYIQHDRHHMIGHKLSIRAVNKYKNSSAKRRKRNYIIRFWCHAKNIMQRVFRCI